MSLAHFRELSLATMGNARPAPSDALVWATFAVAEQQEAANCLTMAALMPADGKTRAAWIDRAKGILG